MRHSRRASIPSPPTPSSLPPSLTQAQTTPGAPPALLRAAVDATAGADVNQAAAIALKNLVRRAWKRDEGEREIGRKRGER